MFTQPPQTPVGGFVDGSGMVRGSRLRAAWLNYVAGQFPNALDAIIGGYYQFTGSIRLSSDTAQIKINAPAIGQPMKLLGFTTIGVSDDANYATGTGALTVSVPATFSAGVTMTGALTFSNTVQFNGAVTVNAATTFTSNGDITLQSGCTLTGQSGSALTMNSGSTTTINGSATLAGNSTLSSLTSLTAASGATISLATNVNIGTPARTYTRTIDHPPIYNTVHWSNFTDAESIVPIYSSQTVSSGTTELVWAWRPPNGATVTAVSVFLTPAGSHGGVPVVSVSVAKLERANTGAANVASQLDESPDASTYEIPHELSLTGLSITFTEGDLLLVRITPETGANAELSLKVSPPIVTFTRTRIGEE